MSKARELLWTCLEEMQYYEVPCPELINEVKELLAQTEQEPDLWVVTNTWELMNIFGQNLENKYMKITK